MVVFAITGSTTAYLVRPLVSKYLGLQGLWLCTNDQKWKTHDVFFNCLIFRQLQRWTLVVPNRVVNSHDASLQRSARQRWHGVWQARFLQTICNSNVDSVIPLEREIRCCYISNVARVECSSSKANENAILERC